MSWATTDCAPTHPEADFLRTYYENQVSKNRRRKTMVDPKLQYSLVRSFFIVFVLASAIYHVTMSFAFLEVHAIVETLQLPQQHPIFSDLERLQYTAGCTFAAIFFGFSLFIWWAGLNLARKIAGPIFALSRHLNRVAEGQTDTDLSFRKDDYFSELQEAFNRHMDTYRKQLNATRSGME